MMGRLKDSIESYLKALEINSESSACHFNLGTAYFDLFDSAKSIHHYKLCIQQDPKNVDAFILLAKILAKQGDEEEALKFLEQAKDHTTEDKDLLAIEEAIDNIYDDGE